MYKLSYGIRKINPTYPESSRTDHDKLYSDLITF